MINQDCLLMYRSPGHPLGFLLVSSTRETTRDKKLVSACILCIYSHPPDLAISPSTYFTSSGSIYLVFIYTSLKQEIKSSWERGRIICIVRIYLRITPKLCTLQFGVKLMKVLHLSVFSQSQPWKLNSPSPKILKILTVWSILQRNDQMHLAY